MNILFTLYLVLTSATCAVPWILKVPESLEEAEQEPQVIQACLGQNVIFPFSLLTADDVTPDADVISIELIKSDGQVDTFLAVNISGHFLPQSGASGLQYLPGQGLQITGAKQTEHGVYKLRLTYVTEGVALSWVTRTVRLDQQENLQLEGDQLQVYVSDELVFDQSTKQWHVQLICGHFLDMDDASLSVQWKTPSGHLLNSSRVESGLFVLHVPNPVEKGRYAIVISTVYCLHSRVVPDEAGSIHINSLEQRLRVVERTLAQLLIDENCTVKLPEFPDQPIQAEDKDGPNTDLVRDGDFYLVFRLTPRNGKSVYDTYSNVGHHDDDPLVRAVMPPGCLSVDGTAFCDRHYRSKILDLWENLPVEKARLVVYRNSIAQAFFEFNAEGSTYLNWFHADRVVNTSYADFYTEPKNYFTLKGFALIAVPERRFYVSRNHGGCPNDKGWLVVTDLAGEGCRPVWGPSPPYPVVGYIHGNSSQLWASQHVRYADVLAVWVKLGAPYPAS